MGQKQKLQQRQQAKRTNDSTGGCSNPRSTARFAKNQPKDNTAGGRCASPQMAIKHLFNAKNNQQNYKKPTGTSDEITSTQFNCIAGQHSAAGRLSACYR
jgi:hypothetical protein